MGVMACDTGKGQDSTGADDSSGPDDSAEPSYEEGCILVNGEGGYKYIQDAIKVANEGDTILLCDGTYEEAVVVDKGVSIEGSSRDGTIVSAPANSAAFDIVTSGATVSNLTVLTSKDGVTFTGASNSALSSVTIPSPLNYGVLSQSSLDITISDVLIDTATYTGIKVAAGSATIENSTFESPSGFGVVILDGADVTLNNNIFNTVLPLVDDGSDGFAISATDATVSMSNNQIVSPAWGGLVTENVALTMQGDVITDALYGLIGPETSLDATDIQVLNAVVWGLAVNTSGSVVLNNATITSNTEGGCELTYTEIEEDGSIACGGFFAGGSTISVSGGSFSGFNNYGLFLLPYNDAVEITVSDITLDNMQHAGLKTAAGSGQATLSNITVTNMRASELPQPCRDEMYIYFQRDVAIYAEGTFTATGLNVSGNQGWGFSSIFAAGTISNSSFDGNACSGIFSYQGAVVVENSTFTHSSDLSSVYDYQGATLVRNSTFTDNVYGYTYENGPTYTVYDQGYGNDIRGYESQSLSVENSSFTNGDAGVYAYNASNVSVTGADFINYPGTAIILSTVAEATIEDITMTDCYGLLVDAYSSTIEVSDVVATGQQPRSYSYTEYRTSDDTVVSSYSYESTSSYVFYANTDSLTLNNIEISNMPELYYSIYSYESSVAIDGYSMDYAQVYALYGYYYSTAPDLILEGLDIAFTDGTAISVSNYGTATGSVVISDSVLRDVSTGIYLYGPMDANIDGVVVESAAYTGINTYYLTSLELSSSEVIYSGGDGLYLDADTIVVSDSTASGLYGSGLYVSGGAIDVTNNDFSFNANYGMICSGTTITACSGNNLSNNGSGTHSGCDDACGN
jgi:hypothetical protein